VFPSVLARLGAGVLPDEQARFRELGWEKLGFMIPMRDGVRLYTEIARPLGAKEPLPFLLRRTPYNASVDAPGFAVSTTNWLKELVADGYLLVSQDIRGTFKSEGQFVMLRPLRENSDGVDESTDTYDTIEWLLQNVPGNNGRVGIYGTSYLGWTTVMATVRPHPALRAACEEATAADMFLGDDFHHNGAFRLSYGYEYAVIMESVPHTLAMEQVKLDHYDAYETYLAIGSLANVKKRWLRTRLPTWDNFVAHPNYDAFWRRQALAGSLTNVTVPILHVAGWWDQEDFYGPQKAYETMERHDSAGKNFFVAGPWYHGGWEDTGGSLGKIGFGGDTARFYREQIRARWFAMLLKDRNPTNFPEAITFQTGANKWESHTSWPPREGVSRRALYFLPGGRLGFSPPATDSRQAADKFISDPARPVPYRARPIERTYAEGSKWHEWLVEDQRHVHNRPDVLSYETEELTEDLVVTGEAFADLFASTTGTDADWVIKLIDVYPQSVRVPLVSVCTA
jgi:putative CocE/NonD family hydrolase